MIETRSALPVHYTITVQVNHKALVDDGKASLDGKDLRVFYHAHENSLPVEINRIVENLYTTSTTVQFRTQRMIPSNSLDDKSYALVFGGKSTQRVKADRRNVFAFYEDFSSSKLEDWRRVWGEWTVKNGTLFGRTGASMFGHGEVGLYLNQGKEWGDIEVELDFMETGSNTVFPGPFFRVQDSNLRRTTAWWFEYMTDQKTCTMRPFINNKDGSWVYKCNLPEPLVKNKWFHFKYHLLGNKITQWANGVSIQNAVVESAWMIPRGTIALGCHSIYSGSPTGCRSYYDNIKVRLLVESNPKVSPGDICHLAHYKHLTVGEERRPADSCKQIHDANLIGKTRSSAKNGVYWIKTSLTSKKGSPTFCDMINGGWTLVGKISGRVGNIYNTWLLQNVNTKLLKSTSMNSGTEYASLDARLLAVRHSTEVMFSSSDNPSGVGNKWIRWEMPSGREYGTWWNHGVGPAKVKAAGTCQVTVKAWNGQTKVCYQNKYGIMPLNGHGGSYPYTSYNTNGNTVTRDYCMAVGVLLKSSKAHGWTQNANGYDSPNSNADWPNAQYNHLSPHLLVWLK